MTEQKIELIINENVQLHAKVSVLEEELENVQRQLAWLKKQVFGRKTEQTSVIMADGIQLSFLNEDECGAENENTVSVTVAEHTRKPKRTHDDRMNRLEIREVTHTVENMICEKCGAPMKKIGTDKAYDELVYVPAEFCIRRHMGKALRMSYSHEEKIR